MRTSDVNAKQKIGRGMCKSDCDGEITTRQRGSGGEGIYGALPKMGSIWTRNKRETDGKGAHGKLGSRLGEGGAFRERLRRVVRARWWRAWPQEGKGQGAATVAQVRGAQPGSTTADRSVTVALSTDCTREWPWELPNCGWDRRTKFCLHWSEAWRAASGFVRSSPFQDAVQVKNGASAAVSESVGLGLV